MPMVPHQTFPHTMRCRSPSTTARGARANRVRSVPSNFTRVHSGQPCGSARCSSSPWTACRKSPDNLPARCLRHTNAHSRCIITQLNTTGLTNERVRGLLHARSAAAANHLHHASSHPHANTVQRCHCAPRSTRTPNGQKAHPPRPRAADQVPKKKCPSHAYTATTNAKRCESPARWVRHSAHRVLRTIKHAHRACCVNSTRVQANVQFVATPSLLTSPVASRARK